MIADSPLDLCATKTFLRLPGFCGLYQCLLKIEGQNIAGSIKIVPALRMIEEMESDGVLVPGQSRIVESSSGNLGVALSLVCKLKGYRFTCVTDPNAQTGSVGLMRAYGARVIIVRDRDENGGYLGSRIRVVQSMLATDPHLYWTNQYANPSNRGAHYEQTARQVLEEIPDLDYLFVGVGTAGTLTGCARYFAEHRPETKVVAVDTAGSVTFGGEPGPRWIPGLGTSRRPELLSLDNVADVVVVPERETVAMCRYVADRYGVLIGGSTGTTLCGIERLRWAIPQEATVVAISPDLGERYVDTIYNDRWVTDRFGEEPPTAPWREGSAVALGTVAQAAS